MVCAAGFRFSVALTRRVWDETMTPHKRARAWGQSEKGRLWDVVWMARHAAKDGSGDTALYRLSVILKERQRRTVTLKMVCGPGDAGEPVITILMPDED
jgi:hypothetical protein